MASRIKDLPSTATSPAADDYVMIDGVTNGTRKILASKLDDFDGIVTAYANLPVDGTAALNAVYLVRTSTGVWFVSRKQRGMWQRVATTGVLATDWEYMGEWLEEFSDANLAIYNSSDNTKLLAFDNSGGTTGTKTTLKTAQTANRNLTLPDRTGNIATEPTIQTISSNKTVAASDASSLIRCTASLTIQLDGIAAQTRIEVRCVGSVSVAFTAGSGMTINGATSVGGDGAFATLVQISATVWEIFTSSSLTSLHTGLFAFYPLDEAPTSTTCRDVVGGETVTATTGSASTAGKTRLRARLMAAVANQAYVGTNNAADFKFNRGAGAITVIGWIKPVALTNPATIAALYDTGAAKRVWLLAISTGGKAQFTVSTDGSSGNAVTATSTATLVTGTWYFVVGYYNPSTGKVGIVVNAGTPDEASIGAGMFVTTGIGMNIGAQAGSATVSAALQDIGFWSRNLTTAEIAALYSSGNGISYPFLF